MASSSEISTNLSAPPRLRVQTLGQFRVWLDGVEIGQTVWGREAALQLFQFLITTRRRGLKLHKEQIIDRLWPELDVDSGDRNFKVALHAANKTLEPERKPRTEPYFIQRQGLAYGLNLEAVWIDADAFEQLISEGSQTLAQDRAVAIAHYQAALVLFHGEYLPERQYEDWSTAERERLQILALNVMTTVAELVVETNPLESIRLTQQVLTLDPVWENAYRIQMAAYLNQGNRPLAWRTYQHCVKMLDEELGLEPLPETQALLKQIENLHPDVISSEE